jgi:CubicO group peptidase (beta-lactamase class C family)
MALETPDIVSLASRIPISPVASAHFFYQNATFLFLGMLAERMYRKSLSSCMAGLACELGLGETYAGSGPRLDAPPTEIRGGEPWANKTHDESSYMCGGITGYAGIFASAGDLAKFGRAWLDCRIASPGATKRAFSCYSNFPGEEQGLGWYNNIPYFPLSPDGVFCHSGYTGPLLAVNPSEGRVYAMTLNRTYYGRDNQLYRELWAWLLEPELLESMTMRGFTRRLALNLDRYRGKSGNAIHRP